MKRQIVFPNFCVARHLNTERLFPAVLQWPLELVASRLLDKGVLQLSYRMV